MATMELDPLLRKGLRLLHSRNRDSVDQLKALLDEALRQRQGKTLSSVKDPFSLRRESPIPRSKQASPSNSTLSKGNEMKRELGHKVRDDESLSHSSKRPKLDSPHNTPSPTPSLKSESSSRSRKSDESDSDADMNDLAMEIGINCTVCKSFEQTSGNQLVECQECHSLFHQECHKPSVSHQDITDPRLVWYCAKCSRSIKKQSSLVSSSSSPSLVGVRSASSSSSSSSTSSTKNLGSLSSSSRPSPSKNMGMQRPFPFTNLSSVGRSNLGSSSNSSSSVSGSSSNSGGGGSSTRSSMSSANTRSNASGPPAANVLLNAERRVHLMKKKAAAKNAERRKI